MFLHYYTPVIDASGELTDILTPEKIADTLKKRQSKTFKFLHANVATSKQSSSSMSFIQHAIVNEIETLDPVNSATTKQTTPAIPTLIQSQLKPRVITITPPCGRTFDTAQRKSFPKDNICFKCGNIGVTNRTMVHKRTKEKKIIRVCNAC